MDKLNGVIRAYPWGSRTLIPGLRGEPVPSTNPQAELWYGAHPASPSTLVATQEALDAAIAADPESHLGPRVRGAFGDRLPFLLKLLAAAEPLSLQAHPSKEQAEEGFARENAEGIALEAANRNYKDDNHKPELIVALTEFTAMAGFRPLARTLELFAVLDCPEVERYLTMLDPQGDEAVNLRALFTTWITIPHAVRTALIQAIVERARAVAGRGDWIGDVLATVLDLQERYPGDIGVLGALLLNHIHLEPGQAIYLDAGQLHAYVKGMGVEIMANSDNVLRGGLTSKYVDVPELVRLLTFDSLAEPTVECDSQGYYAVPCAEFHLSRHRIEPGDSGMVVEHDGPSIVMCTGGQVRVGEQTIAAGEAAWIPACEPAVWCSVEGGAAEVFWARV
ncbi:MULTISPECIES: mannose-6-phosphate isomerase, class I [unclassified Corynebacterium]|uniref:mannose-6-phosphate isomerase, class I n=1 Tax=unclassified Corynebacterium TaxID=2624378 RepID=UPI0029C9BE53|nr:MULTISPECIES: mannose-6-phosphate isomerase, class I [unclassified Corynebacterium]WPF66638.1 mannose-6-phosphate isomerase, class I [Corynebacterium sp. 22KM0430]WPF69126.1 mannose-6-phosphate isomerase, class I [Corynebacterium sp. 21KM1197]